MADPTIPGNPTEHLDNLNTYTLREAAESVAHNALIEFAKNLPEEFQTKTNTEKVKITLQTILERNGSLNWGVSVTVITHVNQFLIKHEYNLDYDPYGYSLCKDILGNVFALPVNLAHGSLDSLKYKLNAVMSGYVLNREK